MEHYTSAVIAIYFYFIGIFVGFVAGMYLSFGYIKHIGYRRLRKKRLAIRPYSKIDIIGLN